MGRKQQAALIVSLSLNALGVGYVAARALRARPVLRDHYREGRLALFQQLPDRHSTLVMFGDSLTDRGEWSELLVRDRVANRGIAGDTIRGALGRVASLPAADVIAVMLGINDLLSGRSVDDCAADHARLLAALRAHSPRARILLQSVLPVRWAEHRAPIEALNARLRQLCATGDCTYVDVHAALTTRDFTTDGVHLDGDGYVQWSTVLQTAL